MWARALAREGGLLPRVALSTATTPYLCRAVIVRRTFSSARPKSVHFPALATSLRPNGRNNATVATAAAVADEVVEEIPNATGRITRFADLKTLGVHENLINPIVKGMKYETMSDVQALTIQPALAGKDVVAQAKTGTGKTLAFLLPVVQRILRENENLAYPGRVRASAQDIQAIIISPTRELAEQIGEEARRLVQRTGLVVQTAVGGTRKQQMLYQTRTRGCHLLMATPGRLRDLLSDPRSGIAAPRLKALVLDEADRMLDVGFEQELMDILQELPDRSQQPRQTLLYSATMPKNVITLARSYVDRTNFEFVQTVPEDDVPTHEKVPQHIVATRGYANIFPSLLELAEREIEASQSGMPFKAMVFLPTTASVRMAAALFQNVARQSRTLPRLYSIHSRLTQAQRTAAAEYFRTAKSAILFTSDVTARGMDFPNVSHVIQVFSPANRDTYIHRLGRTGRQQKDGSGWLLLPEREMSHARQLLPGLPIQRHNELRNATQVLSNRSDLGPEEAITRIRMAAKSLDPGLVGDVYTSMFGVGQDMNNRAAITDLNAWFTEGLDLPTPTISPSLARKLRLTRAHGVHIASQEGLEDRRQEGRRESVGFQGGRRDGMGFQGGRQGGRGFDRRASNSRRHDPWSRMEDAGRSERSAPRQKPPASF